MRKKNRLRFSNSVFIMMEQYCQRLNLPFSLLMKINRLNFHLMTHKYYFTSSLTALKLKWHQLTKIPSPGVYDK
ncbi:hypothetical protein D083_3974 [Dickeya solani RNS 08.23.3.1.A]|nr:hypothetical protein D083_3974 [Dickeya solani RNS 08.23.3.1.A]